MCVVSVGMADGDEPHVFETLAHLNNSITSQHERWTVYGISPSSQGYYRRASANMALGKFKLALKDFEAVKKVRPKDADAISKYTECDKVVKQQAFARAIAVEDKGKASDNIHVESMSKSLLIIELMC